MWEISPRKTTLSPSGQLPRPLLSQRSDTVGSTCPLSIAETRVQPDQASSMYGHMRSPSRQLELLMVVTQGYGLAKWVKSCGMRSHKKLFTSGREPSWSSSNNCHAFGDVIPSPSQIASWILWLLRIRVLDASWMVPNCNTPWLVFPLSNNNTEHRKAYWFICFETACDENNWAKP